MKTCELPECSETFEPRHEGSPKAKRFCSDAHRRRARDRRLYDTPGSAVWAYRQQVKLSGHTEKRKFQMRRCWRRHANAKDQAKLDALLASLEGRSAGGTTDRG